MNDTIYRQAAIDHWRSIIDATDESDRYDMGFIDGLEFCISDLSTMPSAQQDTDEWCTDCKEYDHERHCCPRWSRVIRETLKDAQPEIIRCKDCKWCVEHYDTDGNASYWCKNWDGGTDADGFCYEAERRTDED